jgi:hypothetical protein
MNKKLFERVCELEARLDLETLARWQAEQRVLDLEKEISRLQYLMSGNKPDETTLG